MTDELNTNAGAGPVEQGVRPGAEAPTLVERLRTDVLWHQRRGNETIARDCQEAADEIERLREVAARMVAGIDHLDKLAREWEPDHSSGADRRGWLLAKDARDDAARLLGPNGADKRDARQRGSA